MPGDLIEVELDDELDPLSDGDGRPPRPPWSLRRWAAVTAALATVGAVAVGTGGAVRADLAGRLPVTGLTGDLRIPRHELWRADAGEVLGTVPGVLVTGGADGTGARGLAWQDGSTAWRHDGGRCTLNDVDDVDPVSWRGTEVLPADRSRVVCLGLVSEGQDPSAVILDPVTGRVVGEPDVSDADVGVVALGAHLVGVADSARGGRTVSSWSLLTGSAEWSVTVSAADGGIGSMFAIGDRLVATTLSGRYSFDPATGERIDATATDLTFERRPMRDGGDVATVWAADGFAASAVATGADGTERWSVGGYYLPPSVDDPWSRDVVPVYSSAGALLGVDAATGDVRWRMSGASFPLLQMAGVIALTSVATGEGASPGAVIAVDAATGVVLWRQDTGVDQPRAGAAVSDGARLAVAEHDGGGTRIAVHDLHDGTVVTTWPSALDDPSRLVPLPANRVAQVADGTLVVLGEEAR
ncbi:PQQ-binding-like beta-propeller repeat protein [Isoptericola sp. b490]|uniref:PQQ-binding-like beta-propeller repeat protein n=1 Tax=Actinotalea lenta TaxID=3064654 RepID=UPI002713A9AA|nr:PQQ-binding-like beta-propeller repeat protein [Isoptericola sp. b490]MDO8120240.1 PQQ-binding-like beta-propeller repeat protein [Isoptericola sp. b490]